jgi:hypothetical protein
MLVWTFLLCHVFELHLKAFLVASGIATADTTHMGHDLDGLLSLCHQSEYGFPVAFRFRPAVLKALEESAGERIHEHLSDDDLAHFCAHSALYYGAYAKGDLKYLGTVVRRPITARSNLYPYEAVTVLVEMLDPIRKNLGCKDSSGAAIRRHLKSVPHICSPSSNFLAEYDLRAQSGGWGRTHLSSSTTDTGHVRRSVWRFR